MRFISYSNGVCEKLYILTVQGQYWADQVYREPGTYSLIDAGSRRWNHHQPGVLVGSDLQDLAASLGIDLDVYSQQSINAAHAEFVKRRSSSEWYELNEGLHYAENILQRRGRITSIDANSVQYQASKQNTNHQIPRWWDSTLQLSSGPGLFAGFTRVGRWWEEIWRARDFTCTKTHHNVQLDFNGSVVLRFDTPQDVTSSASEHAKQQYLLMYGSTPEIDFHDVQHGLYWLGELVFDCDNDAWFSRSVQTVRLE